MWLRKYMKWVVTQESWAASSFQILMSLIKTINLTLPFLHAWIHKSLIMYCFTFLVAFCLWSAIFGGKTPTENRFTQGFVIFTHRAFKKMNFIWILTFYLCLLTFFAHRESNCKQKKKAKKTCWYLILVYHTSTPIWQFTKSTYTAAIINQTWEEVIISRSYP